MSRSSAIVAVTIRTDVGRVHRRWSFRAIGCVLCDPVLLHSGTKAARVRVVSSRSTSGGFSGCYEVRCGAGRVASTAEASDVVGIA